MTVRIGVGRLELCPPSWMSPARGRAGLLTCASFEPGGLESDSGGILHRGSAIAHTTPSTRDLRREVVRHHDRFGP